jgi:hypothetical protein
MDRSTINAPCLDHGTRREGTKSATPQLTLVVRQELRGWAEVALDSENVRYHSCCAKVDVVGERLEQPSAAFMKAEPCRSRHLGIEVDEQDTTAKLAQRGAQVDGGGAFSAAALLVGDCNGMQFIL